MSAATITPPAALFGRKVGMTRVFTPEGDALSVTVVEAGPCTVVSVRTPAAHGYSALQLGFDEVPPRKVPKPMKGVFQKAGTPPFRVVREIRTDDAASFQAGHVLKADVFATDQLVDVTGWTIGRGFQGVVKRHGFTGGRSKHGSMFGRVPGSIGSSTFPSRVWKGKRLPGQMGGERRTVLNLRVVRVDAERNMLLVEGGVPGPDGGLLIVTATSRPKPFWAPPKKPAAAAAGKKAKTALKAK